MPFDIYPDSLTLTDGTTWQRPEESPDVYSRETEGDMVTMIGDESYVLDHDDLWRAIDNGWVTATRYLVALAEDWADTCFPDGGFGEWPEGAMLNEQRLRDSGYRWRQAVLDGLDSITDYEYPEALALAQIVDVLTEHAAQVELIDWDEAEKLRAKHRFDVYRIVTTENPNDYYAVGEEHNYYPSERSGNRGIEQYCEAQSDGLNPPDPDDFEVREFQVDAHELLEVAERCDFAAEIATDTKEQMWRDYAPDGAAA